MKLKFLPSLKEKRKYILFKVISEEKINVFQFKEALFTSILNVFGEKGFSEIFPKLIENLWDENEQIGILRVSNNKVPEIIFSLGLISRIGESRINIKIYKVSGTIKNLKEINLKIKKNK